MNCIIFQFNEEIQQSEREYFAMITSTARTNGGGYFPCLFAFHSFLNRPFFLLIIRTDEQTKIVLKNLQSYVSAAIITATELASIFYRSFDGKYKQHHKIDSKLC
jgi:hypothetical protein